MGSIGKLISTRIENFVLGVIEKRIGFKIESAFFAPAGVDAVPLADDKQFISSKDGSGKYVILGSLMISQGANPGELILYSRDSSGVVKSKIYIKNDGSIEINGNSDYAVSWTDLNIVLQAFTTAINTAFASKLDGGGSSPGITLDLSSSKVNSVRLP